jgi:hypothetical protein
MSRLMRQLADRKYEAVGMDLGQAMIVAEYIGNGSVIWYEGHCYPGSGVVLRPVGCMCTRCAACETGEKQP